MRLVVLTITGLLASCGAEKPPAGTTDGRWCALRMSESDVFVDGERMSGEAAVAACEKTAGAIVELQDSAAPGAWHQVEAGLRRAHVTIMMRGTLDDNHCTANPLAKGCM